MSFIVTGRSGVTVKGLNENIASLSAIKREIPQTKMIIHREGAEFFKRDAVANAHVISGKTKGSIKVESVTSQKAIISAGFGMPFEEKRAGDKAGSPHRTFTEAAARTSLQMPRIIKSNFDKLFARHKTRIF